MRKQLHILITCLLYLLGFISCNNRDRRIDNDYVKGIILSLIKQLASNNKEPVDDGYAMKYPDDFDENAQVVVKKTIAKLSAYEERAFPYLINHIDDGRYSYTCSVAREINVSVGKACAIIIAEIVEPWPGDYGYRTREGLDGKQHATPSLLPHPFINSKYTKEQYEHWWQARKSMTLNEMRIESLEYRINEERKVGFTTKDNEKRYLEPLILELDKLKNNK